MARILIADDDDNIREIVATILTGQGHDVTLANNGHSALTLAEAQDFEVLVTDIMMPKMGGLELIPAIRQSRPEMKILVMSAGGRLDATHYLRLARDLGADTALIKPFGKQDLLTALGEVLCSPPAA